MTSIACRGGLDRWGRDAVGEEDKLLLDRLLSFASRDWSALAVGSPLVLAGAWLSTRAGQFQLIGLALAALGAGLTIGSFLQMSRLAASRRRFPPPGKMVDIGGYRIHVLAEGEAGNLHPVVWFGGGHSAGATMANLHRRLRHRTRSILIDRPGTGWSDTGPFPRSTPREAQEIVAALAAAGESGPFVFAGHSFGGLLAANIARRRPDLIARLVLLDATPLETLVFGPKLGALRQMRGDVLLTGLLRCIGVQIDVGRLRAAADPRHKEAMALYQGELGEDLTRLRQVEISAGASFATWSAFEDLHAPSIAERGWELSVYDGDLGDLPVWVVAPATAEEVKGEAEVAAATDEQSRMLRFFATSRERYMATSSAARRIATPAGSTHQFVYETPDFVAKVIEEAIQPQPEERKA
ncbi:MAG: alpha/beta hydrolase [Phenylobacterium sp.]|uniref:alpha/beta fold hydrolase n=1 Tax=Phenylobacterium sp. TaxID=1871053 RepID=UPI0025DFF5CE|nr:alpha/beta hydrolase [Phenylobacterium sp.]MCA3713380.1 alpha/beta hydrolase [Phenylobacterium sp.]MCA3728794.1 alpha/beta hydrolase [Phenylobacterium sp.]MCA3730965.1 alpha/beta hydrolase [Phenylobacterium sp.]MCA3752684.1 alpha/beta hydrolase [Phenylobacterium sp.]MCA6239643.1 alpha/beta hydrolase [Phenylobacterium sp.]